MLDESAQELAEIQVASDSRQTNEERDDGESEVRTIEEEMKQYKKWMASRDGLIQRANQKGLSEVRISFLMGHSRNTVRKALDRG
ncbi:hypothetical protein [Streptomyces sp. NPDC056844]|uniref:hypothetical protein n=1 Tax=unclassified Streptomyces TaxID=2593676 RepID=UPI0036A4984D